VCDEWSHGERTTPRITLVTGSYLTLQRRMAHTDFTLALWREKEIRRSYEGLLRIFDSWALVMYPILSPVFSLITELKAQRFALTFGCLR